MADIDDIEITDEMRQTVRDTIASFGAMSVYSPINVAEAIIRAIAPLIAYQERERCAKRAELERKNHDGLSLMDFASRQTCDEIAAAIRAAKPAKE